MFDGFLSIGGTELINAARSTAYLNSLAPDFPLVRTTDDYDTLQEALGDSPYTDPLADGAEWVSPDDVSTQDFYGFYPLSIEGIGDSTMVATVTEGILDGGFINAQRDTTRAIRVHGFLAAKNDLALEAGMTWLRNAVRDAGCGTHLGMCGSTDLRYFLAKPPASDDATDLYPYDRFYHKVKATQGPQIIKDYDLDCDTRAREVDFVIVAENPSAYSTSSPVSFTPAAPIAIRDAIVNLCPIPSFKAYSTAGTTSIPRTNLITNPRPATTTGYVAIPGTSGTAALSIAPTPLGVNALQTKWTVASTAAGGGVSRDVTVVAGTIYSFLVNEISWVADNTFGTKRIHIEVEWRTGIATISSVTSAATLSTLTTATQAAWYEGLLAPATATIARVKIVTTAGGNPNWSVGDTLFTKGWLAVVGATSPDYFDGTTLTEFYDGGWSSTVDASTSTLAGWIPTGVVAAYGTGGTGAIYRRPYRTSSRAFGLVSIAATANEGANAVEVVWGTAPSDDLDIAVVRVGTGSGYAAKVNPSTQYELSIYVYTSKAQRIRVDAFYMADLVGGTTSVIAGTPVALTAATWTRISLTATTPIGMNYVEQIVYSTSGTGYTRWAVGDILAADGAMVTYSSTLEDYFDGDTTDTTVSEYVWQGDANLSASLKQPAQVTSAPALIDPGLPVLAAPPTPPIIPSDAIIAQYEWNRYVATIPDGDVATWASTVPTVVLTTGVSTINQVRVRFFPNPFSRTIDAIDPNSYCGEFELSYLPASAVLTVDGVSQDAYASVAGAEVVPADQLLYGANGGPMTWAEMSCGIPYLMTVDIPPTADIAAVSVGLSINRRE